MREALERLGGQGFTDSFRAEEAGLRALEADRLFRPERLVVVEVARFEGESNPDDAAIVFALRSETGDVRGTWVMSFGTQLDPMNAACLQRLRPQRGGSKRNGAKRR